MDDPRKLSTEELVRFCLATRDEVLWAEFVRRFRRVIAGVIFKRVLRHTGWVDHALVDDLVQDTFFKLCKNDFKALREFEFRHEKALHGFLKKVAANVVEDHFRKQKVKEEELDSEITPGPPVFPDEIDRRRQIQKIENCLQQLAGQPNFPRDYKIFWLYYRDGLTAQAISQIPDIGFKNVKGVESALLRLIKWLRDCLK